MAVYYTIIRGNRNPGTYVGPCTSLEVLQRCVEEEIMYGRLKPLPGDYYEVVEKVGIFVPATGISFRNLQGKEIDFKTKE